MLYFSREQVLAPSCLSDDRSRPARDMLRQIFVEFGGSISQERVDMNAVLVRDGELVDALKSLFHSRCAFCESKARLLPYRLRPSEEAGPSGAAPPEFANRSHLYYTWLANAWKNLYPICEDCLPREESIYPVFGQRCGLPSDDQIESYTNSAIADWPWPIDENPVLLDPCVVTDFRKHLSIHPDGKLTGIGQRGEFTVEHFALNRVDLGARRAHTLQQYFDRLCDAAKGRGDAEGLFDFKSMEFGGCWYLFLNDLALAIGDAGRRPQLSLSAIWRYFRSRLQPEFVESLRDAHRQLSAPTAMPPAGRQRKSMLRGQARPIGFLIENFKALEHLEIRLKPNYDTQRAMRSGTQADAPGLVILGENAAGKSSILEAMALALSDSAARRDLALDASNVLLNSQWMGTPGPRRRRRGLVRVQYEDGTTSEVAIQRGFPGEDTVRIPVFAYGAFRMFLRGEKKPTPSSAIRSLFEPDHPLPNPEAWLVSLYGTPLLQEVVRNLKYILAVDQKVDLIEIDKARKQCWLTMASEGQDGEPVVVRTPFAAVSSGFRSVLGMACHIMRGLADNDDRFSASMARTRAVVLIDEIEAHLHPKWKMQIIQGLRDALPHVTFIVTTHDPLCLRGVATEEVRVFRKLNRQAQDEELPTYVEQLDELPAMSVLTIEQLLTSDLFQLHSTDSPDLEAELARAGDLLAKELALHPIDGEERRMLAEVRNTLRAQIGKSLPIGSTEVERLVQEAVEVYLVKRRNTPHPALAHLRTKTRDAIVSALENLG
ncbi:AAA family ATPase [Rhizobium leguminosarum]|uniref:AAA family ATPase n=1 Tax=Rhizobium leguminosarum TaxID=384 RepID=UPI00103235D0|nr:AAA family ATPase [Rhizobium leguminosarum]TAX26552.1 hypothetical protein ELI06_25775 [Rhizobium leguminosarum]